MFRAKKFKPLLFAPLNVTVEQPVTQLSEDGLTVVSFVDVSASSVIDSMPRPSETTLANQLAAGNLNPVSLEDFEVSNLDSNIATDIINSLNVTENEN